MYEVRRDQFRQEGWEDIGEENDAFRYVRSDEVLRGREDDDVEDIIDQAFSNTSVKPIYRDHKARSARQYIEEQD